MKCGGSARSRYGTQLKGLKAGGRKHGTTEQIAPILAENSPTIVQKNDENVS